MCFFYDRFSEISKDQPITSAPVIQHPDQPDVPAYKVSILQPAPAPMPIPKSSANTPAASNVATPRSEPTLAERVLTVSEVNSMFLKSLVQSAQDFLGKDVDGAVISVPSWFDDSARAALEVAAEDAGIKVLQLLDEAGAASVVSVSTPSEGVHPDRTTLVVDVGQSSTSLSVLSIRHGLVSCLASTQDHTVGGEQIDEKLVKFFAKEFTKKTKTPLTVCPATEKADQRAEAKLRIAIEHTKRALSASTGLATCSVESLKDGVDFTSSINSLRFNLEVTTVYNKICAAAKNLLESIGHDPIHVDEIMYVGGTGALPGLDEAFHLIFAEEVVTPFTAGTVFGGGVGDPTSIIARGCVMQARLLAEIPADEVALKEAFKRGSEHVSAKSTSKALGLIFPEETATGDSGDLGGQWVVGVPKDTPVPYRRIVQFNADLGDHDEEKKVGFELWEVTEGVKVEMVKLARAEDDDDEEEEEEEEKEKTVEKETHLASLSLSAQHAKKEKGRWKTRVEVRLVVGNNGEVVVTAREVHKGGKGEPVAITLPAST